MYQNTQKDVTSEITNNQPTNNQQITNNQPQYNKYNKENKDNKKNNSCCISINGKHINTEKFQDIIDFYNNNIAQITEYSLEILTDYAKDMSNEVVIFAMQIAVERNARNLRFIKTTLNNWYTSGVRNLLQAQEENLQFRNKYKPRDETEEEKQARRLKELEEATKNDTK